MPRRSIKTQPKIRISEGKSKLVCILPGGSIQGASRIWRISRESTHDARAEYAFFRQELFGQYGKSNTDTGSPESQIALFSYRISHLTEHMKSNRHDFGTQRALLRLVGKRRQLLEYLKEIDIERYRAIIKTLNLRK